MTSGFTSSMAFFTDFSSVTSQVIHSKRSTLGGVLESPVNSAPISTSLEDSAPPMKPLAPLIRTRFPDKPSIILASSYHSLREMKVLTEQRLSSEYRFSFPDSDYNGCFSFWKSGERR
jgi:hypothetical protein